MKLSKNSLVLLISYIGMLILVCCAAQLTVPLSLGTDGDVTASGDGEADDVLASLTPKETDPETAEREESEETDGETLPTVDEDPEETEAGYSVRTVKGDGEIPVIAVYDGDGTLVRFLDVPVFALPLSDRAVLEEGITVSDDDALSALIEDLGG